jgi:uncharacterized membrane protein YphA (DoxX/SURF4 family)
MALSYQIATVVSIVLFLYYGLACLLANGMQDEFERYGLSRFRRLIGSLELLGAIGLLVGYVLPLIQLLSAFGLAVLMLMGVATRVRVRDSVLATLPATVLMVMNAVIVVHVWRTRVSLS